MDTILLVILPLFYFYLFLIRQKSLWSAPQNMDVYNHLDDLTQIISNKKKKAIELFENTKCIVANLSEDISE